MFHSSCSKKKKTQLCRVSNVKNSDVSLVFSSKKRTSAHIFFGATLCSSPYQKTLLKKCSVLKKIHCNSDIHSSFLSRCFTHPDRRKKDPTVPCKQCKKNRRLPCFFHREKRISAHIFSARHFAHRFTKKRF